MGDLFSLLLSSHISPSSQVGFINSLKFSSSGDFLVAGVGQEHRYEAPLEWGGGRWRWLGQRVGGGGWAWPQRPLVPSPAGLAAGGASERLGTPSASSRSTGPPGPPPAPDSSPLYLSLSQARPCPVCIKSLLFWALSLVASWVGKEGDGTTGLERAREGQGSQSPDH